MEIKVPNKELNLQFLQENRQFILFECLYGSHAYGTATETSDRDIRGVYIMPQDKLYGLDYVPQIGDEENNVVYYELKRFCELMQTSTTTVLEMLYIPKHCVLHIDPLFESVFVNCKEYFLTKDLVRSMIRMCESQISKATGTNKKMNYEKDEVKRKSILDFCFVPHNQGSMNILQWLKKRKMKQENCGLVKVPNMRDGYSLFYSLEHNYKGITRKESANDVCLSSIPKGEVPLSFMQFNKDAYSVHCRFYREYQEWLTKRNTARYVEVENHQQHIDGKNMLHCVRIIQTMLEFVNTGVFSVHRNNREELLNIRKGLVPLESIVNTAKLTLEEVKSKLDSMSIPESAFKDAIEESLVYVRKNRYGKPNKIKAICDKVLLKLKIYGI